MRGSQPGVALITVLLVVAIAALAATALLSSTSIAIHRTAALRDSEQAWWVAWGVEAWVLGILKKDADDHRYVGLDEAWAQPVDHLPVDEGFVRGSVVDQQGLFNLNNLKREVDVAHDYQRQFERLVAGVPKIHAPMNLVPAIQDWLDTNPVPVPGGAKDSTYMELNPPYRTAQQRFTVISELLAVQGMTPELYAALRDLITALPEQPTRVNINTAPEAVLRALSATPGEAKLQQWLQQRKERPVKDGTDMDDFNKQSVLGADAKPDYLTFKSNYFQLRGEVFVGSSRVALYSLIRRSDLGTPTVLAHSADVE